MGAISSAPHEKLRDGTGNSFLDGLGNPEVIILRRLCGAGTAGADQDFHSRKMENCGGNLEVPSAFLKLT